MGSTLAVGGERHYRSNELIVKLRSPASVGQSQQTSSQQAVTNMKSARTFYAKARVNHHLKTLGAWNGLNLHHMKLDETSNKSIEETIEELKQLDEVEFVEPNYILQAAFDNQRSQAYSIDQLSSVNASGVSAQGYSSGTAMTAAAIQSQPQVSASWPILAAGAAPVTVAVIDTGLDMNHSSFAHSIWTNTREVADNGIDDDGNGYVDDIHGWNFVSNNNNPQDDEGHGTHVAGIVLGVGFNIFSPPATTTNVQIKVFR
jgi:subtilisin family serine protease